MPDGHTAGNNHGRQALAALRRFMNRQDVPPEFQSLSDPDLAAVEENLVALVEDAGGDPDDVTVIGCCEECEVLLYEDDAVELATGPYCERCADARPDADGECHA